MIKKGESSITSTYTYKSATGKEIFWKKVWSHNKNISKNKYNI